ncbi:MAG: glycine oxidase ThiO [Ghiorsea sp.]
MKVIVIGAGIVGLLTACRLKQQGVDVVVLEKGQAGQESSWAGAGILCPIHPWLYPDAFSVLINASLDSYPALQHELVSETGISIQRIQSGLLIPCFEQDTVDHQEDAIAWSEKFGWSVERLNTAQAVEIEPTLSASISEALVWPKVAQLRNPELLKAVRIYLDKLGVKVYENSEVQSLLEDGEGTVIGVKTIHGQTFESDAVLLAAGSWSNGLAEQSGFELPVHPVKGQIVLLKTEPDTLKHIVKHDDAYFVPRQDGRVLVGASMENVGFECGNTVSIMHDLLGATLKLVPGLKDAEIEQQWMGFRPGSPDGLPFLGPVTSKPGLWVATGHYRNGVALAPITADVMANWMLGIKPSLDMEPFLPERKIQDSNILGYPSA